MAHNQLQQKLANKRIILASGSPRRRELLGELGVDFILGRVKDYDETYPENLSAFDVPQYIAEQKALHFDGELQEGDILITSDTIVILDGQKLGKPASHKEAFDMVKSLCGKTHSVVTAVCIKDLQHSISFSDRTDVTFSNLSDDEIEWYIENFKPYDKAGAYAIQEWIGLAGIESIRGSVYTVIGLPVQKLYKELLAF
ncbi:MAG: Maf family nucleotide pyrophosphatase [Candidatus Egerieousia sp.]